MELINRFKNMSKFFWIIGIICFIVVLTFAIHLRSDKIYKGITIGDTDASGLSKQLATSMLNDKAIGLENVFLTLKHGDKEWKIPYNYLDIKLNIAKTVDNAYEVGRRGNYFNRILEIIKSRFGKNVDIVLDYNKEVLINDLKKINSEVEIEKKNAKMISKENNIKITPHIIGKRIDLENNIKMIDSAIKKLSTQKINLIIREDKPKVVEDDLRELKNQLSEYTTTFNKDYSTRFHNIKLASSRINGTLLKPNQVFSMDEAIKNRTLENGYKMANAYLNNEIVDEIGGGVCQVTTTLYDAVLLADLDIIERNQHSMLVGYVPPGFDAAVSDKGIDFKFKNSRKHSIYIYSNVEDDKLVVKIFGKKENYNKEIELESQIAKVYYPKSEKVIVNNNLPSNYRKVILKSKNGCKAILYKKTYINGELISREKISNNVYLPMRGKVIIGGR